MERTKNYFEKNIEINVDSLNGDQKEFFKKSNIKSTTKI